MPPFSRVHTIEAIIDQFERTQQAAPSTVHVPQQLGNLYETVGADQGGIAAHRPFPPAPDQPRDDPHSSFATNEEQIGGETGWERECRYVLLSGVARTVKKQNKKKH